MMFRSLAMELHENIATYFDDDKDLCTYTQICPETHNAVHSRRGAVWRTLFAKKYDLPPGRTGKDIMLQYMIRRMTLDNGARQGFRQGHSAAELKCLELLRDLITESFASTSRTLKYSNNLNQLCRFAKASNLLDNLVFNVHRTNYEGRLLQTIQVVLTHLQLDLSIRTRMKGFANSQQLVYSHPSKAPLFVDRKGTINIEYLLHVVNFFKYHMKSETENTLYPLLCDLPYEERPSAWQKPILSASNLELPGLAWKGSYAYIPEIADLYDIRARDPNGLCQNYPIPDAIDYDEGFQELELDPLPSIMKWPAVFERHLHALPQNQLLGLIRPLQWKASSGSASPVSPRRSGRGCHRDHRISSSISWDNLLPEPDLATTTSEPKIAPSKNKDKSLPKPGKDYIIFTGSGRDIAPYQCTGVIHNLPAQSGIPGWQRLSMMKFNTNVSSPTSSFDSSSSSAPSTHAFSTTSSASSLSSAPAIGQTSLVDPFQWTDHSDPSDMFIVDDECWCYEGVILPGGKVILGRWWHPLEEGDDFVATGPFIFWNVGSQ